MKLTIALLASALAAMPQDTLAQQDFVAEPVGMKEKLEHNLRNLAFGDFAASADLNQNKEINVNLAENDINFEDQEANIEITTEASGNEIN